MAASNRARDLVGNQAALQKLPDHRAHPLVHHQLGHDEQGQRQQEPGMHLDVDQEGHPDRVAPGAPTQHRQDQQRQPGEERDDDDPAEQELQRIAGQAGTPDDLVQRPAQDQREVVRILRLRLTSRRGAESGKETRLGAGRIRHRRVIAKS